MGWIIKLLDVSQIISRNISLRTVTLWKVMKTLNILDDTSNIYWWASIVVKINYKRYRWCITQKCIELALVGITHQQLGSHLSWVYWKTTDSTTMCQKTNYFHILCSLFCLVIMFLGLRIDANSSTINGPIRNLLWLTTKDRRAEHACASTLKV